MSSFGKTTPAGGARDGGGARDLGGVEEVIAPMGAARKQKLDGIFTDTKLQAREDLRQTTASKIGGGGAAEESLSVTEKLLPAKSFGGSISGWRENFLAAYEVGKLCTSCYFKTPKSSTCITVEDSICASCMKKNLKPTSSLPSMLSIRRKGPGKSKFSVRDPRGIKHSEKRYRKCNFADFSLNKNTCTSRSCTFYHSMAELYLWNLYQDKPNYDGMILRLFEDPAFSEGASDGPDKTAIKLLAPAEATETFSPQSAKLTREEFESKFPNVWSCAVLTSEASRVQIDFVMEGWANTGIYQDEWVAPFAVHRPNACMRLNHKQGWGCSGGSQCKYEHICLFCGKSRHGLWQQTQTGSNVCTSFEEYIKEETALRKLNLGLEDAIRCVNTPRSSFQGDDPVTFPPLGNYPATNKGPAAEDEEEAPQMETPKEPERRKHFGCFGSPPQSPVVAGPDTTNKVYKFPLGSPTAFNLTAESEYGDAVEKPPQEDKGVTNSCTHVECSMFKTVVSSKFCGECGSPVSSGAAPLIKRESLSIELGTELHIELDNEDRYIAQSNSTVYEATLITCGIEQEVAVKLITLPRIVSFKDRCIMNLKNEIKVFQV